MKSMEKTSPGSSKSLWHNRDYLLLWCGQTLSTIGNTVSEVAFPLLLLLLTHSPLDAGIAGTLSIIPVAILGTIAGSLVDRWDRKRVMIVCDIGRALNMASIPCIAYLGHLTVAQLYCNALIEGVAAAFFVLAQKAAIRNVVIKEHLPAAVAQQEVTEGVNTLFGPLFGGSLFTLNVFFPFIADAASYILSVITLLLIKTPFQQERTHEQKHLLIEIKEGLLWAWRQPIVRTMTAFYSSVALVASGFILVIIVLLQQQHASASVIGLTLSAGGLGSLIGAIMGPYVQKRLSFGQAMIGVRWLIALVWLCFAIAPNPIIVGLVFFVFLLVEPTEDVVYFSYRSLLIPDNFQGRVVGACRMCTYSAASLAPFITGWLLEQIGATRTVYVYGIYLLIITALLTLSPHIRHAKPIEYQKAN